jgi:hypothetical protein
MASPALIRRLCLDVVQRNPTPAEVRGFATQSAAAIATALLGTQEAMEVWLEDELFYFLLLDNFRPTNQGVQTLPKRLRERRVDVRGATTEILLSTGFSLRNPGNDTFVTVVLEQCLGLEVQDRKNAPLLEAGKKVYDGYATRFLGGTGQSQADVVKLAVADPRFVETLLDRHRRRLLGAGLTKADRATVDIVHAGPAHFFDVLAQWLASDAYAAEQRAARTLTHVQFARSLYIDLLERTPTYEELRMVRNAMLSMADPGPLRAVLVKLILDSGRAKLPPLGAREQHAEFVAQCFRTYLRRDPTGAETQTFTSVLGEQQPANPALVVRALLGSAEYSSY